jgi:hypothetical protein
LLSQFLLYRFLSLNFRQTSLLVQALVTLLFLLYGIWFVCY